MHNDQPCPIKIGIEKPISEFSTDFFIPGQARLHLPRVWDYNLSVLYRPLDNNGVGN